ncbi:unnamed protein product [Rhizoctonia solani]|uniref:G domain-containing protein n=1 Tax=Rhizoctonia solani TaxID=456999 RepID=A0A8H3GWS3_9AGAM|nr:unnamed protein product [Rhizoctonia solani]
MYADALEEEIAASHNEPERPSAPDGHPSSPDQDRAQRSFGLPPITTIMLLGPSRSGKSSLFNMVGDHGDNPQVVSKGPYLCTTQFRLSRTFNINGRPFRLIDSPGFHTTSLSDSDIMRKMITMLIKPFHHRDYKKTIRLSGILYLHPEENGAEDERLKETIASLRYLVGDPWLPCVTIAIVGNADPDSIAQLEGPTSPFHSLNSRGAKIMPLALELPSVQEILLGFDPLPPCRPRLSQKVRLGYSGVLEGLNAFIDEITGAHQGESTRQTEYSRGITLEESEASRQLLQTTLDEVESELKSLRSQLEQTQSEYASLRSELQLTDNTEQSKVVQSLQDLNRAIDDFGRSVAEYMVDTFSASLNKEDPTTLDASDFLELQRQFGHQEGSSSLVAPLEGNGLSIEDFIDLALRNLLCQNLCKVVFLPFHPTLATSAEPDFMASLYEEVRRLGPPIVAAKWRACSFMALSKGNKLDKPTIESQVNNLVTDDIQPLLNNLFGQSNPVALTETQRDQLQELVTIAWELNHVLKGEVVTLGDFLPLCCQRGVPFDSKTMVEFEASKKRKPGSIAICTIRLGLTLSHSKGAGKDTSPSVICPATVVTPTIYGLNN